MSGGGPESKNHYIRAATNDRRENYGVNPLRTQIITDFLGRRKVIWVKCGFKRFFQDCIISRLPQIQTSFRSDGNDLRETGIVFE
jgi:hypothetical protein